MAEADVEVEITDQGFVAFALRIVPDDAEFLSDRIQVDDVKVRIDTEEDLILGIIDFGRAFWAARRATTCMTVTLRSASAGTGW